MSNSDFFSLFPPDENPTLDANSQELTDLFAQNAPGEKDGPGEAGLDNFAAMFEEILLKTEPPLETPEMPAAQTPQESPLDQDPNRDEPPEILPHPLVPPFLQSYQTLQTQVAQLTEQTAIAAQQLVAHQRRGDSAEALIQQQAIELTQAQEQLSHTVAELQVHQEAAKRQQLQVETLTEQLSQRQKQLQDLQSQLAESQSQLTLVTAENQSLTAQVSHYPAQIAHREKQIEELRSRLQRQQRYALQYKSALEQCLAQPDFHPSSDISQVVARLTGQNTNLQPWASVGDVLAAFPQSPPAPEPKLDPVPLGTPVGDRPPLPQPLAAPDSKAPAVAAGTSSEPPSPPRGRRALGPDTLSFAVRESPKPPSRPVQLPNFLPRAASVSR